jgi:hypothetical protein
MSDQANPPNARVAAAQALLDRGYGRPTSVVEDIEEGWESEEDRQDFMSQYLSDIKRLAEAEERAEQAEKRLAELQK